MKAIKNDQEKLNPCLNEQTLTYKCLDTNNYVKDKCVLQINNYNLCKSFWSQIRSQRKRDGITPYLPEPEEREQIKNEFFEHYSKNVQ